MKDNNTGFNHSLCDSIIENKKRFDALNMTFIECPDNDGRGAYYEYKNDSFTISIDAWYEVLLERPDVDGVKINVNDVFDLECLFDFIKD